MPASDFLEDRLIRDPSGNALINVLPKQKNQMVKWNQSIINKLNRLREGLKKSIMENSILGGRGVSEGHFPYPIFKNFFAPNGLKIIFRH